MQFFMNFLLDIAVSFTIINYMLFFVKEFRCFG